MGVTVVRAYGQGIAGASQPVGLYSSFSISTGFTIPASGGITVTISDPLYLVDGRSLPVIIQGVQGTLARSGSTYTFTRAVGGGTVAVASGIVGHAAGIASFSTFANRPTTLTAGEAGKTYLFTKTGNWHRWTGSAWAVDSDIVNVMDYGATGDGTTDDTTAINAAVALGRSTYFPAGTYRINDLGVALQSNCTYWGDGRNTVISLYERAVPSTVGIAFYAWTKVNVTIRGIRFTAVNAATMTIAYSGGVNFYDCQGCLVTGCFFDNFFAYGIWIYGSSELTKSRHITVTNCYFNNWITSTGGAFGAIHLGNYSDKCIISENIILGESNFGVASYDGYYAGESLGHKISNNIIENQIGYGIVVYSGKVAQIFGNHEITGNRIRFVKGSIVSSLVKSFGAGIYCVNVSNLLIANNTVSECNQQTDDDSLAPAGIGIASCYGDVVITGNRCFDNKWDGIRVVSSYLTDAKIGRYTITGNNCSNNTKSCYFLNELRNVTFSGNTAYNDVQTNTTIVSFLKVNESSVTGNTVRNNSNNTVSPFSLRNSNSTLVGGNVIFSASTGDYVYFHVLDRCGIVGNHFTSGRTGSNEFLYFQDFTNSYVQGNRAFVASSTKDVSFYNNCGGSIVDRDNRWPAGRITNPSTGGLVIET
jgi:hypothetical protein